MADEEIASRKGFGTYFANERFFLGMSSDVTLKMFLSSILSVFDCAVAVVWGTNKSCKQSLTMRARECLGLVARLLSLYPSRRSCLYIHDLARIEAVY